MCDVRRCHSRLQLLQSQLLVQRPLSCITSMRGLTTQAMRPMRAELER